MVWVDGAVTPWGAYLDSAAPAEARLLEAPRNPDGQASQSTHGNARTWLSAGRASDRTAARALLAHEALSQSCWPGATIGGLPDKKDAGCAGTGIAGLGRARLADCRTIYDDRQQAANDGFGHLACALVTCRTVLKSPLAAC
jgi:hypothetical protein